MIYERCLNPACRRELTDPASRRRGFGPACWRARQPQPLGAVIRALPLARRALEVAAGQLAFDLEDAADEVSDGAA